MNRFRGLIGIVGLVVPLVAAYPVAAAALSDAATITYCTNHKQTYVAVVWPQGIPHLNVIKKNIAKLGTVINTKTITLNKEGLFLLYHNLHPRMSLPTAERLFKPYLPASLPAASPCVAIVFETKKTLEEIIEAKIALRKSLGKSYFTIHINDTHHQTIEAAKLFFDPEITALLNDSPHDLVIFKR